MCGQRFRLREGWFTYGLITIGFSVVATALGWGPHSEITRAALRALPEEDALLRRMGARSELLTNACWMGDYFGVIIEEPDGLFFADDYLLFPEAPRYFDHIGEDTPHAFAPFFRRALQALRTEDAANATRWVGALIHFVQDAICPPHAAGLKGDVHVNMENWVDAGLITLGDYRPRGFGEAETEAFAGLTRRLRELIAEAEHRGKKLRIAVEIGHRSAVKPAMLDSALVTARVTADLLYTLGRLAERPTAGNASLQGTVTGAAPLGLERFPVKIMLEGTSYATHVDPFGRFEFRQLPSGSYRVLAAWPGTGRADAAVELRNGATNLLRLTLKERASALVPNGDFRQSWMRRGLPDYWYRTKAGWENEPILLRPGQKYRLAAVFKPGAGSKELVLVRWTRPYEHALPRFKIEPRFKSAMLSAEKPEMELIGGPDCGWVHLTVRSGRPPGAVCERIDLVPRD